MIRKQIFHEILKTDDSRRSAKGQNLAYFQLLKMASGTWISPKGLLWSERAMFLFQIREIKFLGK